MTIMDVPRKGERNIPVTNKLCSEKAPRMLRIKRKKIICVIDTCKMNES